MIDFPVTFAAKRSKYATARPESRPHLLAILPRVDSLRIDGVEIHLSAPVASAVEWIGQEEPMTELLACWLTLTPQDRPLSPRIVGYPGLGKTTLALAAAQRRGQPAFVVQCTADTRPEDLLITPVLSEGGAIQYRASPLVTAMLRGGAVVLDEGNRMPEKCWASLAPLLDDRRSIDSVVAGVTIQAHADFRCAITMNQDDSAFEIPDYILSRLQPGIELPFPPEEEELRILRYNLPAAPEELLRICLGFLQKAHGLDLPYSVRDGIHAVRFSQKLGHMQAQGWEPLFRKAVRQILGDEALDLEAYASKRKQQGFHMPNMQLGDFFFDEGDPMNPDRD